MKIKDLSNEELTEWLCLAIEMRDRKYIRELKAEISRRKSNE